MKLLSTLYSSLTAGVLDMIVHLKGCFDVAGIRVLRDGSTD